MSDSEEDPGIFGISADLVPPAPIKPAGISEVDFDGLLRTPLKLHEDLKNGCGGQLWPAGMVLGKYLLRRSAEEFVGKDIIELGAGGGLVGLPLLQLNTTLNALSPHITPSIYNWGTSPPPPLLPCPPDIILAADCVYFEPAFPLLLQTLGDLMAEETVCWFCFKKRRRADLGFVKALRKQFVVCEVRDDPEGEKWRREGVFMYKITKKMMKVEEGV